MRVGIIGLGYVGLPLALAFARRMSVLGLDARSDVVRALEEGRSHLPHIADRDVRAALVTKRLNPTVDATRLKSCDAVLVCVPTPLGAHREPVLDHVVDAAQALAPHLRRGMLVVLESTTYPGTTRGVFAEALQKESTGMVAGRDYMLAYSPEREDPGNKTHANVDVPKVVGGLDTDSLEAACALYQRVFDVVPVSSLETAETTKLMENIYRAVNIALVNEMKLVCQALGIDIWEVIDAAATKPFGFMRFNPGPGLGGHCIPVDPFYLTWKARELGLATRFIELAGEVNKAMPGHVVQRLAEGLGNRGKALNGSKVLVLGVAYKRDIADTRESPALEILRLCHGRGAETCYHDPHVGASASIPHRWVRTLCAADLRIYDAVVIATDHAGVDYKMVGVNADVV